VALITGPGALLSMKGGRTHRMFGKLFFIFMIITGILALVVSNLPGHKNFFLFSVGIFSLYMVSSGYRYLALDNLHKGQKPEIIDWLLTIAMAIFGFVLFIGGILQLCKIYSLGFGNNWFGIVLMVFGFLGLMMVKDDLKNYRGKVEFRNQFILMHITRMVGANIAAFTAFMVVNNAILPPIVAWLSPTVVGIPIIIYWKRKQEKIPGMKIQPKVKVQS
jgi:hypothetical protein